MSDGESETAAGGRPAPLATTLAVLAVHRGRMVAERYGGELAHFGRPAEPVGRDTPLLGWSMAKSMLHAVVGMLVADGALDLDAPAGVPEWGAAGDRRGTITLRHLAWPQSADGSTNRCTSLAPCSMERPLFEKAVR